MTKSQMIGAIRNLGDNGLLPVSSKPALQEYLGKLLRASAIEHIDGDRHNNSPANLRVVTIKENT